MSNLEHKTVLITGSTDGIGKQTAIQFAETGAAVLLHGRTREKGERVREEIMKRTGNQKLRLYVADYSSLDEVRRFAEELSAREQRLDVLINNAGIGSGKLSDKRRPLSSDGYELRFAVNYLAPYLLTRMLIPLLKASAPARIVNVASVGQKPLDWSNIMLEHDYDPFDAYKQSKLALIMFTFELAELLKPDHITANCIHPCSLLNTKMVRESIPFGFGSAKSGADVIFHLATSPERDSVTGQYFDKKQVSRPIPRRMIPGFAKSCGPTART
ncbi:SDR family oxidoreductase [Paenibacillus caui]|uniref:SDR family oxidoreductase n=1 Tax=Paenibacillus caui TaxID=2873927 RepID=UPI001CA8F1EA|nr:SDR family oxidoreductase [Paenibacillus caui]